MKNESFAACKTPSQNETGDMKFQMDFDSTKRGDLNFTYLEDPIISNVYSGGSRQDEKPRTIASGGIRIHVKGEYLQSVYKPSICFNGTTFCEVVCRIRNRPSPKPASGPINMTGNFLGENPVSEKSYEFVNPEILTVIPNESFAACKTPSHNETGDMTFQMDFDSTKRGDLNFTYLEDPIISNVYSGGSRQDEKPRTIASGGIRIHVKGEYLQSVYKPSICFNGTTFCEECRAENDSFMRCLSPAMEEEFYPGILTYGFQLDGVKTFNDMGSFLLLQDPIYYKFEGVKLHFRGYLTLDGKYLDLGVSKEEVEVWIGKEKCNVTSLSQTQLTCLPPEKQPEGFPNGNSPIVTVKVGNIQESLGRLKYAAYSGAQGLSTGVKAGIGVLSAFLILLLGIGYFVHKKRTTRQKEKIQNEGQKELEALEMKLIDECKEELQTEVNDLTSDLADGGIPFLDYHAYALNVFFPNKNPTYPIALPSSAEDREHRGENDEHLDQPHVVQIPSQSTESIVEKMMSIWISLMLYKFLRNRAGKPMYVLFKAVNHQVGQKPVDALTHEARNCLSEEVLLREKIQHKQMTISVSLPPQTLYACGLEPQKELLDVQVRVLDCDSISQVKQKIMDIVFGNQPFSRRPDLGKLDIQWRIGASVPLRLQDEDITSVVEDGWIRINTLHHYRVSEGSMLVLVPNLAKEEGEDVNVETKFNQPLLSSQSLGTPKQNNKGIWESPFPKRFPELFVTGELKKWHLVKEEEQNPQRKNVRMIPEVSLTRLLSTKQALQPYVDDLFRSILTEEIEIRGLLLPIKYIFDFLDKEAEKLRLGNSDVLHTWKSNSVLLRFWVNIIKNPEFAFDIHKNPTVDSCLSVIAQTFMAAFSESDNPIGKDSPSWRLLYAKEIPVYKNMVREYYRNIKSMLPATDQEMKALFDEYSTAKGATFNMHDAFMELLEYAKNVNRQLKKALEAEDEALGKEFSLSQSHLDLSEQEAFNGPEMNTFNI
ncbi:unnamed protein product [Darwinula stevensoni]|uniref:Uncharacterized protein n=1 Tax=Darwinula stevensoni TaxID=69355 RepID=A0A7R8X038_9CRUS|nr:unnamed protein product [Darwinula stevensoni]CAG0878845.1 unnamed protein product [Darwinula stevensoni]